MTINALHKKLGKLIAQGHGRKQACVNTMKVYSALADVDGCIIPITRVALDTHEMLDDKGNDLMRSDGSRCMRTALVIEAEWE